MCIRDSSQADYTRYNSVWPEKFSHRLVSRNRPASLHIRPFSRPPHLHAIVAPEHVDVVAVLAPAGAGPDARELARGLHLLPQRRVLSKTKKKAQKTENTDKNQQQPIGNLKISKQKPQNGNNRRQRTSNRSTIRGETTNPQQKRLPPTSAGNDTDATSFSRQTMWVGVERKGRWFTARGGIYWAEMSQGFGEYPSVFGQADSVCASSVNKPT